MTILHPKGYNFVLLCMFYTLSGAKVLLFFEINKYLGKFFAFLCFFADFKVFSVTLFCRLLLRYAS